MSGSPVRAVLRLIAYLCITVSLMPVQLVAVLLRSPFAVRLPLFYHGLCRSILGFNVEVHGTMSQTRPTFFVSNHISYTDITILASLLPASFIAKKEVRDWPLFGTLAWLQRTVFIDRRSARASGHRDDITARLEAGDNLILFAEGTSSDGNSVLPFKSALFSAAQCEIDGAPVLVQPLTIAYTKVDGIPLGRFYRPYLAWYGDMDLASHMFRLVGLGFVTVSVTFHEPVRIAMFGGRKALADHCYSVISRELSAANSGRRALPAQLDSTPADASVPAMQAHDA